MKRFLLVFGMFIACSVCAVAQTVSFTASQIHVGGKLLASGQLCIVPVDVSNHPITASALGASEGAAGALTFQTSCAAVTTGVLASGFTAPDTALATPKNLCLRVTITDASQNGRQVYMAPCVQPASTGQSSWCSTSSGTITCNFDNYAPTLAAIAPVTAPSLSMGNITTGDPGSAATASISGTSPNYALNLKIPTGQSGPNCATTSPAGECDLENVKADTIAAATPIAVASGGTGNSTGTSQHSLNLPSDFATQSATNPQTASFTTVTGQLFNNLRRSYSPGLVTFGDSICNYVGASGNNTAFVSRLASQLGGLLNNTCVSGWWIQDEPMEMYMAGTGGSYNGVTVTPPKQGNNPISLEEAGKNEASYCTSPVANCIATSQLALQTILTHRGTNNLVPASSATTTGTWAADTVITSARASTTNGSTITFSVPTYGTNGAIGVTYRALNSNGGTASVTIDGALQSQGITATGVSGSAINQTSVFTNLYPVAAAGTHTVVITVTSATSASNLISIPDVVGNLNPSSYYGAPLVGSMEVIPYQTGSSFSAANLAAVNAMKQATVSTVASYGYNAIWLPITNVPCANGSNSCTGGFNPTTFVSNLPSSYNPDGLSCSGSTTDQVHPNDCGHQQIFEALQTDLGIAVGTSGLQSLTLAQNIYTANHTLTPGVDGVVYMSGSGLTLTLPALSSPSGPYFILNSGSSVITISAGSGAALQNVPSYLGVGYGLILHNYGGNWLADISPIILQQNIYTTNHTLTPGVDGVVYISGSGLTLTLPGNTTNTSPYYVVNIGTSPIAISAGSGAALQNVPNYLSPKKGIVLNNYGGNWFAITPELFSGTTASIGGSALAAGASSSGTTSILGATTLMTCNAQASDGTNMLASGFLVGCTVTAADTATVTVLAIVAGTPPVKTYNVTVFN